MKDINRIKVVLVEQKKTGKWLAEQLGKDRYEISLEILLILKINPSILC